MVWQKPFIKDIFPINRNPYNLRQNSQFSRLWINLGYHGTESSSNVGPKIWDLSPRNLKKYSDLGKFKKVILNNRNLWIILVDWSSCAKYQFSGKNNLSHLDYFSQIEIVIQSLVFQDLVTRISVQCVAFGTVKPWVGFVKNER